MVFCGGRRPSLGPRAGRNAAIRQGLPAPRAAPRSAPAGPARRASRPRRGTDPDGEIGRHRSDTALHRTCHRTAARDDERALSMELRLRRRPDLPEVRRGRPDEADWIAMAAAGTSGSRSDPNGESPPSADSGNRQAGHAEAARPRTVPRLPRSGLNANPRPQRASAAAPGRPAARPLSRSAAQPRSPTSSISARACASASPVIGANGNGSAPASCRNAARLLRA